MDAVNGDRVTGILVALPRGGRILHLRKPGYRPGAKARSIPDVCALCNVSTQGCRLVPLREALGMMPSWAELCPGWSWCRSCVGHAVAIAGLPTEVLTWIVTAQPPQDAPGTAGPVPAGDPAPSDAPGRSGGGVR